MAGLDRFQGHKVPEKKKTERVQSCNDNPGTLTSQLQVARYDNLVVFSRQELRRNTNLAVASKGVKKKR